MVNIQPNTRGTSMLNPVIYIIYPPPATTAAADDDSDDDGN